MSISRRRRAVLVAQQSAYYRQAQAARGANAGKTMPQIMEPDIGETGHPPHARPYFVNRWSRALRSSTWNDPRCICHARDLTKESSRRRVKIDDFSAGLTVGEAQALVLKIDVIPAQIDDLALTAAG